jgi:hypothetical protein
MLSSPQLSLRRYPEKDGASNAIPATRPPNVAAAAAAEIGADAIAEQQALDSSTRRTKFELRVNIM